MAKIKLNQCFKTIVPHDFGGSSVGRWRGWCIAGDTGSKPDQKRRANAVSKVKWSAAQASVRPGSLRLFQGEEFISRVVV